MNGPLARRSARPALPVPTAVTPASSLLIEVAGRRLHGELRRVPGFVPRFSLLVANETASYLLASFRLRRGGSDRAIPPGELWIDPHSTADLALAISPLTSMFGGALVVRLVNARLQHELIAPLSGGPGPAIVAGALSLAAVVCFAIAFAQPRIESFAVPQVGVANAALRVPYRLGGIGSATYALEDERGTTIEQGPLPQRAGTFSVTLAQASKPRTYTVRLRDAGPLGVAELASPVTALPAPAPPARPLIESLALENAQVDDGGKVVARYKTSATSGSLDVRDEKNTVWARAPISRGGTTTLTLPHFGGDRQLRVTLDARRGNERASTSVGLLVAGAPPAPAAASVAAPPGDTAVSVAGGRVSAGSAVRAAIAPGATRVHLALETPSGQTLASVDVPDGASSAQIVVPSNARGKLVLIATYDVGSGEESIVRHLTVTPTS